MSMSVVYVAIGTLLVALGGLVATYGWNEYNDHSRRNSFLYAVAVEQLANLQIVNDKAIKDIPNPPTAVVYPRLLATGLDASISSGLFASQYHDKLFQSSLRLRQRIEAFNNRLNYAEYAMRESPKLIDKYRHSVRDELAPQLREEIDAFLAMIEADFSVKMEELPAIPLESYLVTCAHGAHLFQAAFERP